MTVKVKRLPCLKVNKDDMIGYSFCKTTWTLYVKEVTQTLFSDVDECSTIHEYEPPDDVPKSW